jgi:type I restriction enzyme M protein
MAAPRTLRNREFSFVRTLCDARFASQRKRRAKLSRRGEKDAAKFKDYLLPLLLLKRLSDVFDDEIDRLAEEYGDGNTAPEIVEGDHSLLRFYLPAEARWAILAGRATLDWPAKDKPKDIGEHLTKAVRAIAKQNPSLSVVIDVVDFAGERNACTLRSAPALWPRA